MEKTTNPFSDDNFAVSPEVNRPTTWIGVYRARCAVPDIPELPIKRGITVPKSL